MTFTDRLWDTIHPYYQTIAAHPFNVELANGTLSKERFEFYIQQDVSYLKVLSKVFALIAQRATSTEMSSLFHSFSKDAEVAGGDLAVLFLDSRSSSFNAALSPASKEYSSYLYKTAQSASLEESIASVLPCFWIYRELSKKMARITEENNPYFQWISLNASQNYSTMTDRMIAIVDEIAGQCSEKTFGLMEAICECSSHFEWRFWEDAYQMRTIQTEDSEMIDEELITTQGWIGINSDLDSLVFDARPTPALLG